MKRFVAWIRALFNRFMDKVEDPEVMLDQAKRDMTQALTANREKAVQAIAQKNRLQQMLDDQMKKVAQLEKQAEMALKAGNRDLARQFMREKATLDAGIPGLQTTLAQAQETVEQVKVAIKRQEEEVRKKTEEALRLKAQWKQAQIQDSIGKALQGLTFEDQYEGSFAAARDKIANKTAEASARNEMFGTSVQGQIMQMEDKAMDMTADEELRKMEERLGLSQTPTQQVQPATSDIDTQLDELEKRINQGQQPG
ncbi:MAG: PspA/IM30 family protein [Armatimonadetes bacterium]|nr:PspA/IM30 family protein [Armatimonadota bacterium]